ncbi:MAG: hypothetical protein ACRC46_02605 [Thermoguttaceae bacterium]
MDIDSRLDKLIATIEADHERTQAEMKELREYLDKAVHAMEAASLKTERAQLETDRVVKSVSRQLGNIGNNNGAMAENYFFNSLDKTKTLGKEKFDNAAQNIKKWTRELCDEFDIVLYNCNSISIVEVKYNADKKDVAKTLTKATTFRQLFPEYKDFTFYLGIAGFVFDEGVEEAALDAGVAVIKQVGDAVVVNDSCLKKF